MAIINGDLKYDPQWAGWHPGPLLSLAWAPGFLAFAYAAALPRPRRELGPEVSRVRAGLPLLPAIVAIVLGVGEVLARRPISIGRMVLGMALAITILARQFAVMEELLRAQKATRIELGKRVTLETQRSAILRAVSHDLMNPLTPIRIEARLLRKQVPAQDKAAHALDIIDRNVDQIERLTSDLLDMVRIQDARMRIEPQELDLAELLRATVGDYIEPARGRGLDLTVEAPPLRALGDAGRLRQVVVNLLTNALKFTPSEGHVSVRVQETSGQALVEVVDTGRGFTPEQGALMFQPFSQVHDRAGQRPEDRGTGLGLFVSQGIVQAHGGLMGSSSPGPGKGARFWFTVPLVSQATPQERAPPKPIDAKA